MDTVRAAATRARRGGPRAVLRAIVNDQVIADHGHPWTGYDSQVVFELRLERCLLMLTQPGDVFPPGPTIWRA